MKKLIFLSLIMAVTFSLSAQSPKKLSSKITDVTLFSKGAMVERSAKTFIDKGISVIEIKDISIALDQNSLQVDGNGEYMILSSKYEVRTDVKYRTDTSGQLQIRKKIAALNDEISKKQILISINKEEEKLIRVRLDQIHDSVTFETGKLLELSSFYSKEMKRLRLEAFEINSEIKKLADEKTRLQNSLNSKQIYNTKKFGVIIVRVSASKKVEARFNIKYFTYNAGWNPVYYLKAEDTDKPVNITYKAEIQQMTGENWDNVTLTLSNGDPNQSGVKPTLNPWHLSVQRNYRKGYNNNTSTNTKAYVQKYSPISNYPVRISGKVLSANSGEPVPFANVIVESAKGRLITGTVSDFEGNYQVEVGEQGCNLKVSFVGYETFITTADNTTTNIYLKEHTQVLQGYVVADYDGPSLRSSRIDPMETGTITLPVDIEDKTLSTEFVIKTPTTIPADGEKYQVDIMNTNLPATYVYFAVPKLDNNAFLIAQITEWQNYNFLPGEISVYFKGSYVGRSYLNPETLNDTLEISLGRDKEVIVSREKHLDKKISRVMSSTKEIERSYTVTVQNKKKHSITIFVEDQTPITDDGTIAITSKLTDDAKQDETTGIITWRIVIENGKQIDRDFGYIIKMPRKYEVR